MTLSVGIFSAKGISRSSTDTSPIGYTFFKLIYQDLNLTSDKSPGPKWYTPRIIISTFGNLL